LKDKDTGQNKGYAFVTFTNEKNAEKAIETLNDSEVKVRMLSCITFHLVLLEIAV
jgi:heterogeneous nuclear ribonucleoprotein R